MSKERSGKWVTVQNGRLCDHHGFVTGSNIDCAWHDDEPKARIQIWKSSKN